MGVVMNCLALIKGQSFNGHSVSQIQPAEYLAHYCDFKNGLIANI